MRVMFSRKGFIFGGVLSLLLAFSAHSYDVLLGDRTIAGWVHKIDFPAFIPTMQAVSWPGTYKVAIFSYIILAIIVWRIWSLRASLGVVIWGLVDGANEVLKWVIGRPRPTIHIVAELDSFPSGHTVHAILFLGLIWSLLEASGNQRLSRICLPIFGTFILLTGLSRVALQRHWPSDVFGAILIGALGLWVVRKLIIALGLDRDLRRVGKVSGAYLVTSENIQ